MSSKKQGIELEIETNKKVAYDLNVASIMENSRERGIWEIEEEEFEEDDDDEEEDKEDLRNEKEKRIGVNNYLEGVKKKKRI